MKLIDSIDRWRRQLDDLIEPYRWTDDDLLHYANTVRDRFMDEFFPAYHVGVYSGTVSIAFAATGKTITRVTGSFLSDGFWVGQEIKTTSVNNPGPFQISAVTATVITVKETVLDEAATDYVVYDAIGAIQITDNVHTYSRDERILSVSRAKLVSMTKPLEILKENPISYMDTYHSDWENEDKDEPNYLIITEVGYNRYRLWRTPDANDWLLLTVKRRALRALQPNDGNYDLSVDFPDDIQRKMDNGILTMAYGKDDEETYDREKSEKHLLLHEGDIERMKRYYINQTFMNKTVRPPEAML